MPYRDHDSGDLRIPKERPGPEPSWLEEFLGAIGLSADDLGSPIESVSIQLKYRLDNPDLDDPSLGLQYGLSGGTLAAEICTPAPQKSTGSPSPPTRQNTGKSRLGLEISLHNTPPSEKFVDYGKKQSFETSKGPFKAGYTTDPSQPGSPPDKYVAWEPGAQGDSSSVKVAGCLSVNAGAGIEAGAQAATEFAGEYYRELDRAVTDAVLSQSRYWPE